MCSTVSVDDDDGHGRPRVDVRCRAEPGAQSAGERPTARAYVLGVGRVWREIGLVRRESGGSTAAVTGGKHTHRLLDLTDALERCGERTVGAHPAQGGTSGDLRRAVAEPPGARVGGALDVALR